MSETTEWVCPWGLCDWADARACRAGEVRDRKRHLVRDTCARRFPPGTTLEEAKRMIGAPAGAPTCGGPIHCAAICGDHTRCARKAAGAPTEGEQQ